jgi:hypothetical protein
MPSRWVLCCGMGFLLPISMADLPPGEPNPEVKKFIRQLDAADPNDRDKAEQAILSRGSDVLDQLPRADDPSLSAEQKLRLGRLLPTLMEQRAKKSLEASRVIWGETSLPLQKVIERIRTETGNRLIDLRESLEQGSADVRLDPLRKETTFWEFLQLLEKQSGLITFPNQEGPAIGLAEGAKFVGPEVLAGPLRLRVNRVICRREFIGEGTLPELFFDISIDIEPRLRPLQFQIAADDLTVTDEAGNNVPSRGPDRQYLTLDEGATSLAVPLRFEAPARSVRKISRVAGTIELAIAAESMSFVFSEITQAKNVEQRRSNQQVILDRVDTEQPGLWGVHLIVSRDDIDPESYLQTELRNEAFLVSAQGRKTPAEGGMNTQDLGDGRTECDFIFVDLPGKIEDYKLEVTVPGRIVRGAIPFSFGEIELP